MSNSLTATSVGDAFGSCGLLGEFNPDTMDSMAVQQQLQLASNALGLGAGGGIGSYGAAHGSNTTPSVPISIPMAAPVDKQQQHALSTGAASVPQHTGCVTGHAASMPNDNAMAVAVAQLKLQQLMAVEQIQQQLQDEVMRLLPLI